MGVVGVNFWFANVPWYTRLGKTHILLVPGRKRVYNFGLRLQTFTGIRIWVKRIYVWFAVATNHRTPGFAHDIFFCAQRFLKFDPTCDES